MAPKVVTALEPDPATITTLEKVAGGLCLTSFVLVWITSIASPFLLIAALKREFYVTGTVIVLASIAAYVPWNKGVLAKSMQHFVSRYAPCYFKSVKLVFEGEHLPSSTDPQMLYAIHPHGVFSIGWAILFCHQVMEHVRFCFAPALYLSPFFRLYSRCTGNPGSAAKLEMIQYMKNKESLALPPGGFEEATLTCTTKDRVYIKRRTGFIRLCLQNGVAVRPVYVFGEKGMFWNIQGLFRWRLALNRYGIPTILPWGNPLFGFLPKNTVELYIVCGAPMAVPKIENPTKADVEKWHEKYVAALVKLFEDHKEDAYGPDKSKTLKLEIW